MGTMQSLPRCAMSFVYETVLAFPRLATNTSLLDSLYSGSFFHWNRPSITMFTIDKMSGMLLPGLRPASPRWLNLLARVIGRYGGHFKKGMWMRSTYPGRNQWLVKNDKRRAPLRSVPFSRDCNRIINFITQICLP